MQSNGKEASFSIRATRREAALLDMLAAREQRSRSDTLRRLILSATAELAIAPTLPLDLSEGESETPTAAVASGNPDAYQRQALATWGSAADSPREQRLHALLGLVGEAGEVANLVKKQLYKPGVVAANAAVIDELADVAYYLAVLASLYGVTFDGLFAHLAGKLAGGHGWLNPSNSTGLEVNGE